MNETTQRFRDSACWNGVLAQIQQRRRVDTARCSFRCAVAALLCFMVTVQVADPQISFPNVFRWLG